MWDDLMSEAEDDLIEMVRDPGTDFTLTITREGNRWHVRIRRGAHWSGQKRCLLKS